jgi:predicted nucleotidyltransferase
VATAGREAGANGARARIAERIAADADVRFAFLFGSRAGGRPRPDSDWDLAVYLSDALHPAQRATARDRIVAALEPEYPVDLVVLNEAPPLLAHRAIQGERVLMRDEPAFVRFAVRTLAASGDEAHWRDLHAREQRRRLERGRFGRP